MKHSKSTASFADNVKNKILKDSLRLVAWETTKNCNLSCSHCRASAANKLYENELNIVEAFRIMDEIAEIANPIIILTGGEPLLRDDIFKIADYGSKLGHRMVIAPNGTLITKDIAIRMADVGIKRVSVSIDGASRTFHDKFRGMVGAFDAAIKGIKYVNKAGIDCQINTTITKNNLDQIPYILKIAEDLGVVAYHVFLLVPTGRAKSMYDNIISSIEYEKTLNWFYEQRENTFLNLKATCAPQYYRILRQRAKKEGKTFSFDNYGLDTMTRGCLAGIGFCFISNVGIVQPCGYTKLNCGNIRKMSFQKIWYSSEVFSKLRNLENLKGKCGKCSYAIVCGGCRARAFEATGDYMAEEPLCSFYPK